MRLKSVASLLVGILWFAGAAAAQQNAPPAENRPDPLDRFFTLPGIEFSPEQQAKVAEIRGKFSAKIEENQREWNSVITAEQNQARREAFRKGRDEGLSGEKLRKLVDDAVKLTDAQRRQQDEIQQRRNQLLTEIRAALVSVLTAEQQARFRRPRPEQELPAPTHANVKYGPHERNVMDLWLAKSDRPTPVLVSIHGGGFLGGDKRVDAGTLDQCLASGISVAAITYRFSSQAIAPASFRDSARAVQTMRMRAKEWNLDPEHFAATGSSAGAGISLWLGFHDDLADPENKDPVLRESSRLSCMMVSAGQTSYDPRFIRKLFPEFEAYKHGALARLFDVDLNELDNLPAEKYRLFEECSPIHHLSKDDPPAMLGYGAAFDQPVTDANIGIHHARFGKALKEKMDELNIRCVVTAGGEALGERVRPIDFMKQAFEMEK